MCTDVIILVEDDHDDQELFANLIKEAGRGNTIMFFDTSAAAFNFIAGTDQPIFIIFCDIHLPGTNGLELKQKIDADPALHKKSIPFIFYSTWMHKHEINDAFTKTTIQGFFKKPNTYAGAQRQLELILNYWDESAQPEGC